MTGFGMDAGDLVIDSSQNTCRDGDYAVAHVDGRVAEEVQRVKYNYLNLFNEKQ